MIHHLYSILFTLFLTVSAPFLLLRCFFRGSFRKDLVQRLGFYPRLSPPDPLWVHAASVGEVFCSLPLIRKIKAAIPDSRIIVTTMTRTGREAVQKQVPEADAVFLFPFDHPTILQRVIAHLHPKLILIAETELWPNLLRFSGKQNIPVLLFNGRISDRSFRRYRLLRFFFKPLLRQVSLFLMQTEKDRERIIAIGGPPEKIKVTGSIKFDQPLPSLESDPETQMKTALGLRGENPILIAGSTRPGEEEILLRVYEEVTQVFPGLLLILAPRHLDRLEEVEDIFRRKNLSWVRRTSLASQPPGDRPPVILLDTMGELSRLYSVATIVFIGGSLVPLGGQNPLEPLFFKKCVLFGPHMSNFSEIARILTEAGGALQVTGEEELRSQIGRLLRREGDRREIGERGFDLLLKHRGATEKIFQEVERLLFGLAEKRA